MLNVFIIMANTYACDIKSHVSLTAVIQLIDSCGSCVLGFQVVLHVEQINQTDFSITRPKVLEVGELPVSVQCV